MGAARLGVSRFLVVPLSLALLALAMSAPLAFAGSGGNSANAKLCQKGGWQYYVTADGATFANQDDCVSYGAHGGTLTARWELIISPAQMGPYSAFEAVAAFYGFTSADANMAQTFTVTNISTLTTGALSVSPQLSFGFSITDDSCDNSILAPGGTCSFTLAYQPVCVGQYSEIYVIDFDRPFVVALYVPGC
jgi:hypothetical protein